LSTLSTAIRSKAFGDDDPLNGVANLFDLGLVFIVGMIVSLFAAYHLQDLFSDQSNLTITKKSASGQMEVIVKQGKQVKALRVSADERSKGQGTRLGVAYRLEDGTMVYVPDEDAGGSSATIQAHERNRP